MRRLVPLASIVALVVVAVPATGDAAAPERDGLVTANHDHDLRHPMGVQQAAMRAEGLEAKLQGKADGAIYQADDGRYVELELEDTDRVFVMLGEFGDEAVDGFPDAPGPLHNEIPEPDRSVDNTTIWQPDYTVAHYEDMYFNRMLDWYQEQSSGRYAIEGDVQDWARAPRNTGYYGNNDCGSVACPEVWEFLQDVSGDWYQDQLDAGMTAEEIAAYVQSFDEWDRYDQDGDGNFDEPDGYIDHFQMVHAGVGEETGGGEQGVSAIWSHRWYTFFGGIGTVGPDGFAPLGGFEIGDTNVFVGDYTIQPENGGLGVFAHEYAHDLGLPDQYDTAGGENGTGFWTVMSSGSYLGAGDGTIGDNPGHFNAWEKFQLGWLNYTVVDPGAKPRQWRKLAESTYNTDDPQGLFVLLPDRERTTTIADIVEGTQAWYSESGDDLDNTMTTVDSMTIPGDGAITMKLWSDIETDWDYGYVRASVDGGATWTSLEGVTADGDPITTDDNPNGTNFGNGITGQTDGWVDAVFDGSAYAGQEAWLQFRYYTDGAVSNPGFLVDDIVVGGFTSNAEPGDETQWTLDGFRTTTGTETTATFNAYVGEFRQYRGYDRYLRTGPYHFGFLDQPDRVEHFPYQDGLLLSYWDSFWTDNNTSQHPGQGLILPIDAHPEPLMAPDGTPWRPRVQVYDATFARRRTQAITLPYHDGTTQYAAQPYVSNDRWESIFDDSRSYWDPAIPGSSVQVVDTDTRMAITRQSNTSLTLRITQD